MNAAAADSVTMTLSWADLGAASFQLENVKSLPLSSEDKSIIHECCENKEVIAFVTKKGICRRQKSGDWVFASCDEDVISSANIASRVFLLLGDGRLVEYDVTNADDGFTEFPTPCDPSETKIRVACTSNKLFLLTERNFLREISVSKVANSKTDVANHRLNFQTIATGPTRIVALVQSSKVIRRQSKDTKHKHRPIFKKVSSTLSVFDGHRSRLSLVEQQAELFTIEEEYIQRLLSVKRILHKASPSPLAPFGQEEIQGEKLKELETELQSWEEGGEPGTPTELSLSNGDMVVNIACGKGHMAVVTLFGKLFVWGRVFQQYYKQPKPVDCQSLDVVNVVAWEGATVAVVDNETQLEIALLLPNWTLQKIPMESGLSIVKVSESKVYLRQNEYMRETLVFMRLWRQHLRKLRYRLPDLKNLKWGQFFASYQRIEEDATLLMRCMLTLLGFLQERTLCLDPRNCVETDLLHLIQSAVGIIDQFWRRKKVFQMFTQKKNPDSSKHKLLSDLEVHLPKLKDVGKLVKMFMKRQPDERQMANLSEDISRRKSVLKDLDVSIHSRNASSLKKETKVEILHSFEDDNLKLRFIHVSASSPGVATTGISLTKSHIQGGPDFSDGSFLLTHKLLLLIDKSEKNIAKYNLQFVWLEQRNKTEIVITVPEGSVCVRGSEDNVKKCYESFIYAIHGIFDRNRSFHVQDVREWQRRKLGSYTFVYGPHKDACYEGEWENGKPCGLGIIRNLMLHDMGPRIDYSGEMDDGVSKGLGVRLKYLDGKGQRLERVCGHWSGVNFSGFATRIIIEGERHSAMINKEMGTFKGSAKNGIILICRDSDYGFYNFNQDKENGQAVILSSSLTKCAYGNGMFEAKTCRQITDDYVYNGTLCKESLRPCGYGVLDSFHDGRMVRITGSIDLPQKSRFPLKVESTDNEYSASIEIKKEASPINLKHLLQSHMWVIEVKWDHLVEECEAILTMLKSPTNPWEAMRTLLNENKDVCQAVANFDFTLFECNRLSADSWSQVKLFIETVLRIDNFPLKVFLDMRLQVLKPCTILTLSDWTDCLEFVVQNFQITVSQLYALLRVLCPALPKEEKTELASDDHSKRIGLDLALEVLPQDFYVVVSQVLNSAVKKSITQKRRSKITGRNMENVIKQNEENFSTCRGFFNDNFPTRELTSAVEVFTFLSTLEELHQRLEKFLEDFAMDLPQKKAKIETLVHLLTSKPPDHLAFNLVFTQFIIRLRHQTSSTDRPVVLDLMFSAQKRLKAPTMGSSKSVGSTEQMPDILLQKFN